MSGGGGRDGGGSHFSSSVILLFCASASDQRRTEKQKNRKTNPNHKYLDTNRRNAERQKSRKADASGIQSAAGFLQTNQKMGRTKRVQLPYVLDRAPVVTC